MKHRPMALALSAAIFCSCEEEGPQIDIESAIPVRVEAVARHPIAEYVTATGTAMATREATLQCLQDGLYQLQKNPRTKAPYAMGDRIPADEVIALLENPELENQVSIDSKKLAFTSALREYDKQQALFEKGGITLSELTAAERAFIDARYSLENAELRLAELAVRTPFDGVLVDLEHFSPRQRLTTGTSIGKIMEYAVLYTEVSLPGKEIDRVLPQQKALVTHYGSATVDTLVGLIEQVAPVLDAESRMFKATLSIANDSLAIRPGMFVKVDIVVAAKDSALVIPKEVLRARGDGQTAFVVEKGLAFERHLETGMSNRLEIEVLSGLEVDEQLVVEGFETLRHRSKVKVARTASGAKN